MRRELWGLRKIDTKEPVFLYEVVKDGSKKNLSAGKNGRMSATSFASWAKQEVK